MAVPPGFRTCLFRPDSSILRCWMFQAVALGYCQTTVNSVFREALQAPRRKHGTAGKPVLCQMVVSETISTVRSSLLYKLVSVMGVQTVVRSSATIEKAK